MSKTSMPESEFQYFFRVEWPVLVESENINLGRYDHEGRARAVVHALHGAFVWEGLRDVVVPGMDGASWDRQAAWLVFSAMKKTGRAGPVQSDLFGV